MHLIQALPGRAGALHIDFGLVEVGLISGFDLFLLGLPLGFVLRGGVFELLNQAIAFLETAQVIGALPPFGQIQCIAECRTGLNGFANGIPQQVGIGGEMHMGFDHKGISAGFEAFLGVFFLVPLRVNSECPALTTS